MVTGAKINALGTDLALLSPRASHPWALPVMLALTPSLCSHLENGSIGPEDIHFPAYRALASITIQGIMESLIYKHGIPCNMASDQGTRFTAKEGVRVGP